MSSASLRHTLSTLLGGSSPAVLSGAAAVADLFEQELDEYAELVVGPSRGAAAPDPVGFMTRGEGASFTERAASVLQRFDMPPASREHHRFLAELFEHKRAFLKVEWHRGPDGGVVPAASCYFRRRPEVETVMSALGRRGLDPTIQDELRALAFTLDKRSIHFVAAALKPGSPIHHKLYFSQYVTRATRPVVGERLARLLARIGESVEVRAERQRAHEHMLPALGDDGETTIFVSLSFTDRERLPGIKIDYPETTPAQAAVWARDPDRPQVEREARMACASLGRARLSYLGVRLQGDRPASLKYYVDLPGARERS